MKKGNLGKKVAAWAMRLAMVLVTFCLPMFAAQVRAAVTDTVVSGTRMQYISGFSTWSGTTKLDSDGHRGSLNRYSKADNCYLYVNFTSDADQAITKIWIKESPSLTSIDNYAVTRATDNVNGNGTDTYLYYTKDRNAGDPIASLGVWNDKDGYFEYVTNVGTELQEYNNSKFNDEYSGFGYSNVGGDHNDLNKGAGSGTAYVYLYYKCAPYVKTKDTSICVDGQVHNGNVTTANGAYVSYGAGVSTVGRHSQSFTVSKTGCLSISGTTTIEIKAHNFSNNGTCECGMIQVQFEIADGTAHVVGPNPDVEMTGDLVIPGTVMYNGVSYPVTEIGYRAFYMSTFTGNLVIPNSVKTIGKEAFIFSDFKGKLTLGNSVETIGNQAFLQCSFTGDLTIPDSVTKIDVHAFYDSGFTGKLTLGKGLKEPGQGAFGSCGFTGNLIIPDNVTYINKYSFMDCQGLTGVTIPNSVKVIGDEAFAGCTGIKSLVIPNSVTEIEFKAFFKCTGLTGTVVIPDSVKKHGSLLFWRSSNLTGISVPCSFGSLEALGDDVMNIATKRPHNFSLLDNTYHQCSLCGEKEVHDTAGANRSCSGCGFSGVQIDRMALELDRENGAYIGVNLYTYMYSGISFYVDGNPVELTWDDLNGYWMLPIRCAAAEFADTHTLTAQNSAKNMVPINGEEVFTYSGKDYCDTVIANAEYYSDSLIEVCSTLNEFSAQSRRYFGYNAEGLEVGDVSADLPTAFYEMQTSGTLPRGISYAGSSLLLQDQIGLRHYFNGVLDADALSCIESVTGRIPEITVNQSADGNRTIVDITAPYSQVGDMYQIYINGENTGYQLDYGVLTYCNAAKTRNLNRNLVNTCNALYNYFHAVSRY